MLTDSNKKISVSLLCVIASTLLLNSCGSSAPDLQVLDNEFDGQGGIRVISHDNSPIKINKIILNRRTESDCVFSNGGLFYLSTASGVTLDKASLPVIMRLGEERRLDYSIRKCGNAIEVTISTDHGDTDYNVTTPRGN